MAVDRQEAIPDFLEDRFLSHGPFVLQSVIREVGGQTRASDRAQISPATLSRWMSSTPGAIYGPRRDGRSYRSLWFGYPPPFPGLDRIVEEILGPGSSFIGTAVERWGIRDTSSWLRCADGFGFYAMSFDREAVERTAERYGAALPILRGEDPWEDRLQDRVLFGAADRIGLPRESLRRWMNRIRYPRQWQALDRICGDPLRRQRRTWLEEILSVEPDQVSRRIPDAALRCLLGELPLEKAR